ncbi:sugar ABC transporter substrate-binding protein [Streptomyces mangrovisoli]|uniref:Sugar ABC transporter substrate-binding protein n=1 Tax=Streptomyces mangrovisoli TaxID=1428628 RepID=A0A1J4NSU1_9ACTN|nr:sugar ABC transporter substrate-binding protein [Streptomyces mangrovisoli]OIJ65403.1 sugar ABC transporter substrate-binding protein [Streptomyces mangrovisoli]
MSSTPSPRRSLLASGLAAGLLLSGCGLIKDDAASGAASGPLTLGLVNGGTTRFDTCLQEAVENDARYNLAHLVTAHSQHDADSELAAVQDMIDRKVDAIILQPVSAAALQDDLAKARKADVPVFLISVAPDDTSGILGAVVADLTGVGALDARWIGQDAAKATVQVGVIGGSSGSASDQLEDGFRKALPANASVVDDKSGRYDPAVAAKVARQMIEAHPGLQYAFVANEDMALAARTAFDEHGGGQVKIVSVDGTDEALAALKDGRLSATVSNSAADTGTLAVENTLSLLRKDKPVDKITKARIRLITRPNADTAPVYCPSDDS